MENYLTKPKGIVPKVESVKVEMLSFLKVSQPSTPNTTAKLTDTYIHPNKNLEDIRQDLSIFLRDKFGRTSMENPILASQMECLEKEDYAFITNEIFVAKGYTQSCLYKYIREYINRTTIEYLVHFVYTYDVQEMNPELNDYFNGRDTFNGIRDCIRECIDDSFFVEILAETILDNELISELVGGYSMKTYKDYKCFKHNKAL